MLNELTTADGPTPRVDARPFVPTAGAEATGSRTASRLSRLNLSRRALAIAAGGLVLLAAASGYAVYWWTIGSYLVSTDDAYVGAKNATLSPKIAGYVSEIAVPDNAQVKAGDVLIRIDDGDYKLALQSARDQVAVQAATLARLEKQMLAQQAAVAQAQAQLASARAGVTRAQLELNRQNELNARQVASRQILEQSQANYEQAVAAVQAAEAGVNSAVAGVEVLKAQQEEARRTLKQLETLQARAERDLAFTVIRAPFDGVLGNRAVQVGDYVQPAQRLASLVPLDAVYIEANFKETQLARLHPGQPVTIKVDALPGEKLAGRLDSLSPAAGSVFSLLPPDNATGNFTKIVQRLPVRVLVPLSIARQAVLRPGMSVFVTVDTKAGAAASDEPMTQAAVSGNIRTN